MRIKMLRCKQASSLVSQSLDKKLSWGERFGLRFHLMICSSCSRFARQLKMLSNMMQKLKASMEHDEHIHLSVDAKKRIAGKIESEPG